VRGYPCPAKMNQEIVSAINRALFHQKAPADTWIMNIKKNTNGAITAITHQHVTAAMALVPCEYIINAACTVVKKLIDIEENESWEWLNVHAVPLVRYMAKGTEGLQMIQYEIHAENVGVVIPFQERWLVNPHSIRGTRQSGAISALSVVFVVKGDKVARRLANEGIKAVGVWYRVEPSTNIGPDSRCDHCCGWGHIEKCSDKPTCS
jgi:hypothetical protein